MDRLNMYLSYNHFIRNVSGAIMWNLKLNEDMSYVVAKLKFEMKCCRWCKPY
jgi:hypothetical protein